MNAWVAAFHVTRALKWLLWAGFFGFCLYFVLDRAPHLTQFGHLTLKADFYMFGLPLAAVVAGLFELMFRAKVSPPAGGLQR